MKPSLMRKTKIEHHFNSNNNNDTFNGHSISNNIVCVHPNNGTMSGRIFDIYKLIYEAMQY
jgi:hypothetical protein